eukprot:7424156-Ditylum_brightwellii.AAC.1
MECKGKLMDTVSDSTTKTTIKNLCSSSNQVFFTKEKPLSSIAYYWTFAKITTSEQTSRKMNG